MPAKTKSTFYKPLNIENPFKIGQDDAYADILKNAIDDKKLWQKTTYIHFICLFLFIILFIISMCQQEVVPVLINVMPSGESQYLGEVKQGSMQVPESAIIFQIRTFITKFRSVSTDYIVVYQNLEDCFTMTTYSYSPIFRNILLNDSPLELVGEIRRTVDIESILLVTGRSYQVNWYENIYDSNNREHTFRYRAVVTIQLLTPTSETIVKNPLGIYIENVEMIEL